ncbi:HPr family phosphocarrier protein [bacterium]|nr:HPr family phosphocarrier protein [bacterium]MBU1613900.1 HPr family phosphocarrier protein [bacterium]
MKKVVPIQNKLGLHARSAASFVRTANQFTSDITVRRVRSRFKIEGKSILGLMSLAASCGKEIEIDIQGEDEEEAMEALVFLVNNKFGEGE